VNEPSVAIREKVRSFWMSQISVRIRDQNNVRRYKKTEAGLTDQHDYEKELKSPASLRSEGVAASPGTGWRLPSESHGGISGIGIYPGSRHASASLHRVEAPSTTREVEGDLDVRGR